LDRSGVIPVASLHLALVLTALLGHFPGDDDRAADQTKAAPPAQSAGSTPLPAAAKNSASKKDASKSKNRAATKTSKASTTEAAAKKKGSASAASATGAKKSAAPSSGGKDKAKDARVPAAADSGSGGDVRVRTAAEMRKPRSEFLLPPGATPDDRYRTDPVDWEMLPAWRQTSFFGIRARGQFFVYVVDHSLSMIDDERFARATIELRKSVFALQQPQKFEVIFYNSESLPMPGGPIPRSADLQAKNQLVLWLRLIEPIGGTDPRIALKQALMLRPDAVFLLSDGDLPEGTVKEVSNLNTRRIPIHCVDLAGGLAGNQLKLIAADSGGEYASRPGDLQGRP
jgi:von Willebrand factor type A domain